MRPEFTVELPSRRADGTVASSDEGFSPLGSSKTDQAYAQVAPAGQTCSSNPRQRTPPLDRTVAGPEQRPDRSWRWPLQVIIQSYGKYQTGFAHFETVAYCCDLEHVKRLQEVLI